MNILIFIFLPLIVGLLIVLTKKRFLRYISIVGQGFLLYQSLVNLRHILLSKEVINVRLADQGLLGISLTVDEVSAIFILLVSFLFFNFAIYIWNKDEVDDLFYFLFLTIQGVITLIFLSMDLFNVFVLIEVATIICAILIMYLKEKRAAYDGLVYLMINTVGIMFYLFGVAMLYKIFGTLDMMAITDLIKQVPKKSLILPLSFVFTGMGVKSSIFPMFSWLPKAHGSPGAPTIVSAILSGIYIKSTLYMWIRLYRIFNSLFALGNLILVLGILTALGGIVFAILSKEMKQILAYHTISQIGLILIGVASSENVANYGGVLHMINHALFKSLLFLTIGKITQLYNRKRVDQVSGVLRSSPLLAMALTVGILGITGAPFFNGSISKYLISLGYSDGSLKYILELINIGTMLSFVKLGSILFGTKKSLNRLYFTEKIALIFGSLAVFITGVYGFQIFEILSGSSYQLSLGEWGGKFVSWIAYFLIGYLSYKHILPKIPLYNKGYVMDLSFNTMIFMIPTSFVIYFIYLTIAL